MVFYKYLYLTVIWALTTHSIYQRSEHNFTGDWFIMCHKYTYFILQKFWYACVLSMAAVSSTSHTCLLVCRSLVMQAKMEWIHKKRYQKISALQCKFSQKVLRSNLVDYITSILLYTQQYTIYQRQYTK